MNERKIQRRKPEADIAPAPTTLAIQSQAPAWKAGLEPAPSETTAKVGEPDTVNSVGESVLGHQFSRMAVLPGGAPSAPAGGPPAAPGDGDARPGQSQGGIPLGPELRTRFEHSLGVDLGAVRIHDSASTAAGAASMGAAAFTVAQDIYWGHHESPTASPEAEGLLAHEIVHTVQSKAHGPGASSPTRISTPAEPQEIEARRTASALQAGRPATVAQRAAGDVVYRNLADDFAKAADEGEKYNVGARDEEAVKASKLSIVGDTESAKAQKEEIAAGQKLLIEHMQGGPAKPEHSAANDQAILQLETLIDSQTIHGTGIEHFQRQYQQTVKDYDRFVGAIQVYQKTYPGAAGIEWDEQGKLKLQGQEFGDQAKKNLGMNDAQAKILKDSQSKHGEHANRSEAEKSMLEVDKAAGGVKTALENFNIQTKDLQAANDAVTADIGRVPKEDDKGEMTALQGEMKQFKSLLSTLLSGIKLVMKFTPATSAGSMAGLTGPINSNDTKLTEGMSDEEKKVMKLGGGSGESPTAEKLEKVSEDHLDSVAKAFFAGRIKLATALDNSVMAKKEYANTAMYAHKLEKSQDQLQQTIRLYKESLKSFAVAKANMLKAVQQAGKEADRLTGNKGGYEAAARLIGEATGFLAQVEVTLQHGKEQEKQGDRTAATKEGITTWTAPEVGTGPSANPASAAAKAGNKVVDPAGIRWYTWTPTPAYKKRAGLDKSRQGEIVVNHVNASSLAAKADKTEKTASGFGGATQVMQTLTEDLQKKQAAVSEARTQLLKAMGLFGNKV